MLWQVKQNHKNALSYICKTPEQLNSCYASYKLENVVELFQDLTDVHCKCSNLEVRKTCRSTDKKRQMKIVVIQINNQKVKSLFTSIILYYFFGNVHYSY